MKTILVINGETYWQDFFPEYKVVRKKIQHTTWLIKNGRLYVIDSESVVQPDAILWRVGAIPPSQQQINALNLIVLSGIPCVNDAMTLKRGYDRLSMLSILKNLSLPVIDFNVVTKATQIHNITIDYPFVVKVGNYHGGFGKVLVKDETQWQDIKDMLFVTNDYITIEPFIDYQLDIRYIGIGDKVWAMARKGKFWKANVETTDFQILELKEPLLTYVKMLQQHLNADIVAIDVLEDKNGKFVIVEYNDIPGLSGFSDELKYELAEVLKLKIEN